MSADNWATCPKCLKKRRAEKEQLTKRAADSYGKVSAEDFDELRKKADSLSMDIEETFREDYELGILESGEFYVSYQGQCSVCDFGKQFKHEE